MYGSKKRGSSGKNSDKARGADMKPEGMHHSGGICNVNDIEVQLSSVVKPSSRAGMNIPSQSMPNPSLTKDLIWGGGGDVSRDDYKRFDGRSSLFPK